MTTLEKAFRDEEELDELPPIDGDDGEAEDPLADRDLDDEDDKEADLLDDRTGEDEAIEEDFGEDEPSAIGDDREGLDGDVVEVASFEGDSTLDGDDAPGVGNDDFDFEGVQGALVGADAGEEGLEGEGEELKAEDLPPLDADDEVEQADEGFYENLESKVGAAWDERPWELLWLHPTEERVTALAACDGGAFLFTGKLWFLGEGGQARELPARGLVAPIVSLSWSAGVLDAKTADGGVLRSTDEGKTFARKDEIDPSQGPSQIALEDGRVASALVEESGRSVVVADGRILADVSSDADSDGEEARVLVMARRGDLAWLGGGFGVLAYRLR